MSLLHQKASYVIGLILPVDSERNVRQKYSVSVLGKMEDGKGPEETMELGEVSKTLYSGIIPPTSRTITPLEQGSVGDLSSRITVKEQC